MDDSNLDAEEKELLESFERGEWVSLGKDAVERFTKYAQAAAAKR